MTSTHTHLAPLALRAGHSAALPTGAETLRLESALDSGRDLCAVDIIIDVHDVDENA